MKAAMAVNWSLLALQSDKMLDKMLLENPKLDFSTISGLCADDLKRQTESERVSDLS